MAESQGEGAMAACCKFCKRPKGTTPWRRAFGRECATCNRLIALRKDLVEEHGGDKSKLATVLAPGSSQHTSWMQLVDGHEAKRSSGRYSKGASVQAYSKVQLVTKSCMGYLWPLPIYKATHDGQHPQKAGLKVQVVNGKAGVLMKTSVGDDGERVVGVEEVWSTSASGVCKQTSLGSTGLGDTATDTRKHVICARSVASGVYLGVASKGCEMVGFRCGQS